jgi:hypothetical protein
VNQLRALRQTLLRRDGVTPRSGFAWFAIAAKDTNAVSANTGRSPIASRTGQVDPKADTLAKRPGLFSETGFTPPALA